MTQRWGKRNQKGQKFNTEAFDYDGDFGRDARAILALESLTQEEVADLLESVLSESARQSRTVLAFSREHEAQREVGSSWDDLDGWKVGRVYE